MTARRSRQHRQGQYDHPQTTRASLHNFPSRVAAASQAPSKAEDVYVVSGSQVNPTLGEGLTSMGDSRYKPDSISRDISSPPPEDRSPAREGWNDATRTIPFRDVCLAMDVGRFRLRTDWMWRLHRPSTHDGSIVNRYTPADRWLGEYELDEWLVSHSSDNSRSCSRPALRLRRRSSTCRRCGQIYGRGTSTEGPRITDSRHSV